MGPTTPPPPSCWSVSETRRTSSRAGFSVLCTLKSLAISFLKAASNFPDLDLLTLRPYLVRHRYLFDSQHYAPRGVCDDLSSNTKLQRSKRLSVE
jgi:hypothetical protein